MNSSYKMMTCIMMYMNNDDKKGFRKAIIETHKNKHCMPSTRTSNYHTIRTKSENKSKQRAHKQTTRQPFTSSGVGIYLCGPPAEKLPARSFCNARRSRLEKSDGCSEDWENPLSLRTNQMFENFLSLVFLTCSPFEPL